MNDYCLSFALRQPCEILLRSKGFAFISQGEPGAIVLLPIRGNCSCILF